MRYIGFFHVLHMAQSGTIAKFSIQNTEHLWVSLADNVDAPIREVSYPPQHTELAGRAEDEPSKRDSLHAARYEPSIGGSRNVTVHDARPQAGRRPRSRDPPIRSINTVTPNPTPTSMRAVNACPTPGSKNRTGQSS